MKKSHALVFYSRLPTHDLRGKTRIGHELNDQRLASSLARALILDMLAEYNPAPNDVYDLIFFYRGDISDWARKDYYNVSQYIEGTFSGNSVGEGMNYIHQRMIKEYDTVSIVGSDIIALNKERLVTCITSLASETYDASIVPVEDGGYGFIGFNKYIDVYTPIANWESRTDGYKLFDETLYLLEKKGQNVYIHEKLCDIDYLSDVQFIFDLVTNKGILKPEFNYLKNTHQILSNHANEFKLKI